ncbi:hypothetical protein LINPERPRIM_LOCUS30111, partial [Linum perenne]
DFCDIIILFLNHYYGTTNSLASCCSYSRLNSNRRPRRDGRSSGGRLQWFHSNLIVYWLLLITL